MSSKWAAVMDGYGVNTPSLELIANILPGGATLTEPRPRTWAEIQPLLLRSLDAGVTIDQRKFVRVTPDQRVLSIPIARAHWHFRDEVEVSQAASRQAVDLIVNAPLRAVAARQPDRKGGAGPCN